MGKLFLHHKYGKHAFYSIVNVFDRCSEFIISVEHSYADFYNSTALFYH